MRRLSIALGIALLGAALWLLLGAPPSPHGALVQVARVLSEPFGKHLRVATVSDHSLPPGTLYAALHASCIVRPPDARPRTLVLELTGGARLQLGDSQTDVKPEPGIHRSVVELPGASDGVALELHYLPFGTAPFFRLLHWDRAGKRLEPMPREWIYPSRAEMRASDAPRRRAHLIGAVCIAVALLLLRWSLPPLPAWQAPIGARACTIALLALLVLYGGAVVGRRMSGEFLLRGDARALVEATRSVLEDHDLDLHGQSQLHLYEDPNPNVYLSESETVVALGKHGELYPKHPWLLPVIAAPFYALMGELGFPVLNVLLLLLMGLGFFVCARRAGATPPISACVTLLLGASPLMVAYAYSITIDVLGAALGTIGLALVLIEWPLGGGLLLGGALLVRVTNAWVLVAAACVAWRWRPLWRLGLGAALPVAVLLAMNWHLFGDPFTMSYNRVLVMVRGERALASHVGLFDRELLSGFLEQLFEWPRGLLFAAPFAVLAWAGWPLLLRRAGALALGTLVAAAGLYLTFAVYVYAADSPFGSRFLLPVLALASAPLACALELVLSRRSP